jgi:hypothetical protein
MTDSASTRWGCHYMACEVCQIDEFDLSKDRLCAIGSVLRDASIKAYRAALQPSVKLCSLCEQPLLDEPVFWVDQSNEGVHVLCEEQRLADEEMADAERAGIMGLG